MTLEDLDKALERATLDGEPTYLDVFTECEPRLLDAWIARERGWRKIENSWFGPKGEGPYTRSPLYTTDPAASAGLLDEMDEKINEVDTTHWINVTVGVYPPRVSYYSFENPLRPIWKVEHTNRNTAIAIAWAVLKMQGRES